MGAQEDLEAMRLAEAERQSRGVKPVPFDQGPLAAGEQLWRNVTNGQGVGGLASKDGTLAGSAQEAAGVIPGASSYVATARDMASGKGGKPEPLTDSFMPGSPGDTSATDASHDTIAEDLRFARPFSSPQAQAFFEKEGYSKAPVGGAALYDEAFTHAPARRQQAMEDTAALQGQRSEALTSFYKDQSERDTQAAAAAKAHAAEDQQQIAERQQKLEQATQYYTNDLQDQGKFWQNPGNIVSAIAFSLMPIFSNDPAVGVKLINQAIDRDMGNRQHAASQTLGALRSNLEGYHKIAGDRQAGDLLAQAEAHRIAAQQIQQISMSFESPIAKKQAQFAIEDQKTRQAAAQMEFYKANVHINPSKMDPGLHNARVQGGPDGYNTGVAPLGGAPSPGSSDGPQPSGVRGVLPGGGPTTSTTGAKLSPTTSALIRTGGIEGLEKGIKAGVVKDPEVEEAVRAAIYAKAVAAGENPNKYLDKTLASAREELRPVAEANQKTAAGRATIGSLMTKFHIIEQLESSHGKDPQEFKRWGDQYLPASMMDKYKQITGGDPRLAGNKSAELAAWRKEAADQLRQQTAMVINQNIHDISGGSVSAEEGARNSQVISQDMPWRQQANFLQLKSRELQAVVEAATSHLSPTARILYEHSARGGKTVGLPRPGIPSAAPAPGTYVRAPAAPEPMGPPK